MSTFVKCPCDQPSPPPISAPEPANAGGWVLAVAIIGSSMAFIDSSAVNVALPAIGRDFHAAAAELQWIVEGYSLFLSALILVGGSLGDLFGRRRVFVIGIAVFALASAACAASTDIGWLTFWRCLQGIGAALATPGSLALISANFSGAARGRAIGTWSGFAAITAAIGPLLGGWLTQYASWRYVFLINVPLALFTIVAAQVHVTESRADNGAHSIDGFGAALATAALGGFTFGLIRLQADVGDRTGIACSIAGVLLLAGFAAWERRAPTPMMPLDIFASPTFSGANIYTFLLYAGLGGSLFFVPFDLQNVHGYSPTAAGGAMVPFIAIMFVASRWSGGLVARVGARLPLVVGAIVAGVGFVAYASIGVGGSYWSTFFPAAVVLGIGGALFVAPLTTTVMESIDPSRTGIASGINNAVARVAGLLAVAALGIALSLVFYANFDRIVGGLSLSAATRADLRTDRGTLATGRPITSLREPDRSRVNAALAAAYTDGFRCAMLIAAALSWLAALVALRMIAAKPREPLGVAGSTA